jgi:nucleotide-binding universal stress UspA family protein
LIAQLAKQLPADLVVTGTVGRTGIPGFFIGNTAESLMQVLNLPVLAVKPAKFVSPVTLP